jgi:hypothetical protein
MFYSPKFKIYSVFFHRLADNYSHIIGRIVERIYPNGVLLKDYFLILKQIITLDNLILDIASGEA